LDGARDFVISDQGVVLFHIGRSGVLPEAAPCHRVHAPVASEIV
jgi:hypothetical protein